jgi:hypothetical protein
MTIIITGPDGKPLSFASEASELTSHPWPEPDWWDFSPLPWLVQNREYRSAPIRR